MKRNKSEASEYTLDEQDVRKIINATSSLRNKVIIELLSFTGCRREELVLLRFMDIKLDYDMIMMPTVKQEKRRAGDKVLSKQQRQTIAYQNQRRIPIINDDLKRDLVAYMEVLRAKRHIIPTSRLIQSRQKESITEVQINNIVTKASERAGIKCPNPNRKHVHPHMFRHTFVRYARKMGMDYVAIQEIVGHSNISTTMGMYGRPTWDDKVAEARKMKDFGRKI